MPRRFVVLVASVLFVAVFLGATPLNAQTATEGERIAHLEGAYEHLATKADIEQLRTEVVALRSEVHAVSNTTRWIITAAIAIAGLALGFAQYRLADRVNRVLPKEST